MSSIDRKYNSFDETQAYLANLQVISYEKSKGYLYLPTKFKHLWKNFQPFLYTTQKWYTPKIYFEFSSKITSFKYKMELK